MQLSTGAAVDDNCFFSLPHVRLANTSVRYMRCQRRVLEIQACKSGPSSWFIDESVSSGAWIRKLAHVRGPIS